MPTSVRQGIYFLWSAWAWLFFSLYKFLGGNIPQKMLLSMMAICIVVCFYSYNLKKWGRVLAILSNIMLTVYFCIFFYYFLFISSKTEYAFLCAVAVILFVISSFYLFSKESADYYAAVAKAKSDEKADSKVQPFGPLPTGMAGKTNPGKKKKKTKKKTAKQ